VQNFAEFVGTGKVFALVAANNDAAYLRGSAVFENNIILLAPFPRVL